jgi:hypothetical protein
MKPLLLLIPVLILAGFAAIALVFLTPPTQIPDPWIPVATLHSVPDDGIPHRYALRLTRNDALTPFSTELCFDGKLGLFTEPCWGQMYGPA